MGSPRCSEHPQEPTDLGCSLQQHNPVQLHTNEGRIGPFPPSSIPGAGDSHWDQTAACSKRGSCQPHRECPFKWLLLHANIISSTQVCVGLLGRDVLGKGNIQQKICTRVRVWVCIKTHKYWYLCTHIISQNWIYPLRASTHFTDIFVSPDVIDLNYKTSNFKHSIHFHTEWKQMKLSFFSYFLHSMLWWNEIKYDTLQRQTLSPFKTRGLLQVSLLIVWVCSKPS